MSEELRRLALELAVGNSTHGTDAATVVATATAFVGFLTNAVPAPAQEEAAKKTRGRPAKGEVNGVATPAATATEAATSTASPTSAPAEADPFADAAPAADVVPQTTMDAVRKAVLALRDATDQGTALAVLKKYGAANFGEVKPEVTGNIVRDAQLAMPAKKEEDPFAETPSQPAADSQPAVTLTLEDVKKAITQTQKRTSTEAAQKVVMEHGGSAPGAGGVVGPSLKALPAANYAKVIDLLGKLPTTK